jgi:beta-xylosidase
MRSRVKQMLRRAIRGAGGGRFLYPRRPEEVVWDMRRWGIGIFAGPSPLQLSSMPAVRNPVLTHEDVSDVDATVVADPFLFSVGPREHYLFFEAFDRARKGGVLSVASSPDLRTWTYERVILAESFHLSFPCVFEWQGERYMVPESWQAGAVFLYRATAFPYEWTREATLLRGDFLVDPAIFHRDGRWWMFVETNPARTGETLRLYSSDALTGPYTEHPKSPIVDGDPTASRPAGRVVDVNGHAMRFSQRCFPTYGMDVSAFEILELTEHSYAERPAAGRPVLGAGGWGQWNRFGMHHVDAHRQPDGSWVAAVDGWTTEPYE